MVVLYLHVIVLVVWAHAGLGMEILHMNASVTKAVADSFCGGLLGNYRLIDDSVNDQMLKSYIRRNKLSLVWLGIQRKSFTNWTWVDDDIAAPFLPGVDHSSHTCGGVSTVARSMKPMRCNYGGHHEGVVCEHREPCPSDGTQYFEESNKCFSFQCGVSSWYDARDRCEDRNLTIAKLDTQGKIDALSIAKGNEPTMSLCGFFWVGLSKEDWYRTGSSDKDKGIRKSRWGQGEPIADTDCATAEVKDELLVWSAVKCEQKHIAVCQTNQKLEVEVGVYDTILPDLYQNATDNVGMQAHFTPVIIGTLIPAVVMIIVILSVYLYKRRKRQTRKDTESKFSDSGISECIPDTKQDEQFCIWKQNEKTVRELITKDDSPLYLHIILKNDRTKFRRHEIKITPFISDPAASEERPLFPDEGDPLVTIVKDVYVDFDAMLSYTQSRNSACDILVIHTDKQSTLNCLEVCKRDMTDCCVIIPSDILSGNKAISAITVTQNNISCQEPVDVYVYGNFQRTKHMFALEEKPPAVKESVWTVAMLVALVMMIFKGNGYRGDKLNNLKQTSSMRQILQKMSKNVEGRHTIHPERLILDLANYIADTHGLHAVNEAT